MTHYSRAREFDLAPFQQSLTALFSQTLADTARLNGRSKDDTVLAGLLALAVTAQKLRAAFDVPVEAWAEACRIAASPTSLTNTLPTLPLVEALEVRLHNPKANG